MGASYDLEVMKTGPSMATAGSNVTYTVVVTNHGPDEASEITFRDAIPPGMTFVSLNSNGAPNFNCTTPQVGGGAPDAITCGGSTMAAQSTATFIITYAIPPQTPDGTSFTNVATVSTPPAIVNEEVVPQDLNEENNSSVVVTSTPPTPTADLLVMKTGPSSAGPGTSVVYTITLANSGSAAATAVSLFDSLPGTMTFVSLQQSGTGINCTTPLVGAGGTVTCTAASYPSGGATTLTLVANIPADTASGTELTNVAVVTSANDPNAENDASATTLVVSAVDLSVTKTAPPTVNGGANITYVISVSNAGPDPALNARLVDTMPPGTTFIAFTQDNGAPSTCTRPAVGATGTIDCSLGNGIFAPGTAFFRLTVNVADTTSVSNTAFVSTDSFDTDTSNDQSSATTAVSPRSNIAVQKAAPATVTAGTNLTYTIFVPNSGPSTATQVTLTDTLPPNTTLVSFSQTEGPAFSCNPPGPVLNCSIASLAPGEMGAFALVVAIPSDASPGILSNTANVTTSTTETSIENNTSTATTTIVLAANVGVTKVGPASVTAGTQLVYSIVVSNAGPSSASNVSLADVLPAGTTFVSIAASNGPAFNCTTPLAGGTGTVTCTTPTLPAGASTTFTLTLLVAPTATGSIANTAAVSTTTTDNVGINNSAQATSSVNVSADVAVTKTAPASVNAGGDIAYTLVVSNTGPSSATSVAITDVLPAGTTFVSIAQGSGPAFNCTSPPVGATGTVTCTIASLLPAATATFTLTINAAVGAPSPVVNTATVASPSDTTPPNNSSTASTALVRADASVTKTAPSTVAAGQSIAYTLTVANAGPSDAAEVTLTDLLPAGTTFISLVQNTGPAFTCTAPAVGAPGSVSCSVASLSSGATASFTLILGTLPGATGAIANTASVGSTTPDSNSANNASTASTTVSASADMAVVKSGPASVNAGGTATYTINVVNNGPSTATGVTLSDPLPAGTTFVSLAQGVGPAFTCITPAVNAPGTVSCTIATLAPSAPATFTLVINVGITTSGLVNIASVASTSTDPVAANNTSTASTAVVRADVSVVKTAPATATAGQTIAYSITVANAGPSDAAGVVLTDTLPAGTTFASLLQNTGPAFTCTTPAAGAVGTINCSLALLPAGATATFALTLNAAPGATGAIANTASITSTTPDSNSANNTTTATTMLAVNADVAVTKTGPASVNGGGAATYTINVVNNGPSTATGVTLSDPLPAGTTFVSLVQGVGPAFTCTTPAVNGPGTVSCTIATLAPSTPATFTLVINVPVATSALVNTASVSSTSTDPVAANNTSTASTGVVRADVSVVKTAPATATAGQTIAYSITVANAGPSDAAGIVLTDTLPAGTTFASLLQNTGPAFTCTTPAAGAVGTVNCNLALLPNGATATFALTLNAAPGATGTIANTASITSTTPESNSGNNTTTATTMLAVNADVAVTKTGPASVNAGGVATYTITVANNGPSLATGVTLSDLLPAGTTFLSIAQGAGPAFACTAPAVNAPGTVSCTIASLAPSTPATFTLAVNVPIGTTTLVNTAMVTTTSADGTAANNASTASTGVTRADVSVVKTAPATAIGGQTISYSLTVANAGPSAATQLVLADTLPAGTRFASLVQDSGPAFTCTTPAVNAAGTVSCTNASLAANATATFTLVVNVLPGTTGPVANTATVATTTPDPATVNNSATATVTVTGSADVSIAKTGPSTATAGQTATYTIVVSNAGPSDAANVTVTDVLPANTTFVSNTQKAGAAFTCTTPAVNAAGTVSCSIAVLANGASATFELVVNIDPTATQPITNTATVASDTPDPRPANASAAALAAIALAPVDIAIEKTAAFDPLSTTRAITWTITVRNPGPGVANNVVVSDTLQAGLALVSATPSQGTCVGNPAITCTLGALAAGASATITLSTTLASNQTTAINVATVTSDNPDTNAANNSATGYAQFTAILIPTLSWSGLIAMMLLLMVAGGRTVMRRRD